MTTARSRHTEVVDDPMTVGAVAQELGVTVRTLHHYDEIGLLVPGHRTAAGYRRYFDEDLDRLRRILFYRELGLGLDEIADILADGASGRHGGGVAPVTAPKVAPRA